MHNSQRILTIYLLSCFLLSISLCQCQSSRPPRLLQQVNDGFQSDIKGLVNYSIQLLTKIINFLKRLLVLMTLLFLIENMINFWVLASSYIFLAVQMPDYFKNTLAGIYTIYNESFLHYIGLNINYPNFTANNQIYNQLPNKEVYQFNPIQFALQPTLLLILTLIELSFFKWVLKVIKKKAKENRDEYLKEALEAEAGRKEEKKSAEVSENLEKRGKEDSMNVLANLFRSNKVSNQGVLEQPKHRNNFVLELTYKIMQQNMKQQLKTRNYKHWSEDVHVNKMQKIAALIINFMTGLLMPCFSLVFDNQLGTFWQKINLMLYYLLLGLIFLFPFLYISRNVRNRVKGQKETLRSSDIETLCQYFLNMGMSVTLGIRSSPIPFLITTFTILSLLLVHSFMEGGSTISCQSMSMKKVNNILHKLTFWLYNLAFLGMCAIMRIKENHNDGEISSKLEGYAEYCSIACLGLFAVGGCHELLQFAINTITIIFKVVHMIFTASNKEQYQKSQKRDEISQLEPQSENIPKLLHQGQQRNQNIFNSLHERQNESESEEVIKILKKQIRVHQGLLNQLQEI